MSICKAPGARFTLAELLACASMHLLLAILVSKQPSSMSKTIQKKRKDGIKKGGRKKALPIVNAKN